MRTLQQIATRRLALLAGFVLGLGVMTVWGTGAVVELERTERRTDPVYTSRAALLAEKHDCWNGVAPADMEGKVPGHVVVTTSRDRTVYSARLVGPALDQTFGGVDAGLVVHAFCR